MHEREFLTLAGELATQSTEAAWRSSVSRAYYAAFHAAARLLASLGFTVPRGEQAHGYLWLRIQNCGLAELQQAGANLKSLRRDRNFADYEFQRPFRQSLANVQVQTAVDIIRTFESAIADAERSHVAETIQTYERNVLQEPTWRATDSSG